MARRRIIRFREEWRRVPSIPQEYEISSYGRFARRGRIINGSISGSTGYRRSVVYEDGERREVLFHRLVAEAFIGPCPDGLCVNHKDAQKDNNVPANLEYMTLADNLKHAWGLGIGPRGKRHGRHTKPECSARGEGSGGAKRTGMTEARVRAIRKMRQKGAYYYVIAEKFGISKSQAVNIALGRQWRHV